MTIILFIYLIIISILSDKKTFVTNALNLPIMVQDDTSSKELQISIFPKDALDLQALGNDLEWENSLSTLCSKIHLDEHSCSWLLERTTNSYERILNYADDQSKFYYVDYSWEVRSRADKSLLFYARVGKGTYGFVPDIFWWGKTNFSMSNPGLVVGRYCSLSSNIVILLDKSFDSDSISNRRRVSLFPWYARYKQYYATDKFIMRSRMHPKSWPSIANLGHNQYKPVNIGNDVWIGANAVLMPGVTIHDGAVVGAYAVVWNDVEPYSIVGGNPAVLLGYRFEKHVIEELLRIKWWEWTEDELDGTIKLFQSDNVMSHFLERAKHIRSQYGLKSSTK